MNDEERDHRIETLTDAIADVNRAVAQTSRNVGALAGRVDATIDVVGALAGRVDATIDVVGALAGHESTTKRDLGILAGEVTNLARLLGDHLVIDHGYRPADRPDA